MSIYEGVGSVALFCKFRQCSSRENVMKGMTEFYLDLEPAQIYRTETIFWYYDMQEIHVNFLHLLISTQSRVCNTSWHCTLNVHQLLSNTDIVRPTQSSTTQTLLLWMSMNRISLLCHILIYCHPWYTATILGEETLALCQDWTVCLVIQWHMATMLGVAKTWVPDLLQQLNFL
jgi:hypothetical protein